MKNSNFVSDVQKLQNALNAKDLKFIKEQVKSTFYVTFTNSGKEILENEIGKDILKLVSENSNDFTKDIAIKCLENKYELSDKQAWCIAYQVINNIEVYVLSYGEDLQNQEESFSNDKGQKTLTKGEMFMLKYKDLLESKELGNKIDAYMIKHSTELRFFTKIQKDYWKQWSLGFEKVAIFTDIDYALDVLNKLNEEITKVNPNDKRKHELIKTSQYI